MLLRRKEKLQLGVVVFEVTEACNQNCRFCYNHWRPEGSSPVDGKQARRTLRHLLSQADVECVSFSGGEPTLLPGLADLALTARFHRGRFNILSNGTLISRDQIRNLASIGIDALQVPLLSSEASVHEALTGLKGSWAKACATLRSAVEILGSEHVASVLVITAANAGTIPSTLSLLSEMGVSSVMVNRFNMGGNGILHAEELALSPSALAAAFREVSDFAISHPQMRFISGVCTPMCLLNPSDYPGIRFTSCSTDFKERPLALNCKGELRFCNHSPFVLGNIWERPLREILEDEALAARYSGVPEKCASCKLFARCKGGCRAAAEQVHGTFSAADPIIDSL